MLRPARLCIAAVEPERHHGPLAPRGFERSNPRYSGADLAHSPHRPGLDGSVLKRDYLLTNQPCEFTVTAVGEVKVFVLHDARWHLATYRDPAKWLAAIRARKGPKSPGSHKHPVAGRKVKDPSRATQLLQLTRLHGWLPRQRIYLLDPQGNCFSVAVPRPPSHQGGSSRCARPSGHHTGLRGQHARAAPVARVVPTHPSSGLGTRWK